MIDENFLSVRLLQALNIGAHRVEMEAVKHQSDIIAADSVHDVIRLFKCIDRALRVADKFKGNVYAVRLRCPKAQSAPLRCSLLISSFKIFRSVTSGTATTYFTPSVLQVSIMLLNSEMISYSPSHHGC